MKGTKIVGIVLAVAVMIFVVAPIVSAQTHAGILGGQWFKIKLGVKGYEIAGDTVLGKGAGSLTAYLYFSYTSGPGEYTITTCMQDDENDNIWHKNTDFVHDPITNDTLNPSVISKDDNIYGEVYPQVWEFGGTYLWFYNGIDSFYVYPTLYTKITADGATLKNASISNVACILSAQFSGDEDGDYAAGSCSISGPLVSAANVAKGKVPAGCQ
jgi:hypothetical protein